MQWHLEILVAPLILLVYSSLRGGGIFKDAYQGASGILAGSPGSRLETLLTKADAYAVGIVIVTALICALSAVVVAVSRGEADAPLVCWLIAMSGLLCRSALPVSLNYSDIGRNDQRAGTPVASRGENEPPSCGKSVKS
jgi:predicted metal-binding membrane protein